MNRFVYGVAVSALIIGTGGAAVACEKYAKLAALENPAAAPAAAAFERGFVLAQSQDDADKEKAEEEGKEKKPDAVKPSIGPLAQSQDEADKEKAEEEGKEKKPDALPTRERGLVLAQTQDGDKEKETTGEEPKEEPKPEGDGQK